MKSRRAEQVLQAASFTNEYGYQYVCIDSAYAAVELAEIRIWYLIRQRIIKSVEKNGDIMVDESDVAAYLKKHPAMFDKWKGDYEYCRTHKIVI